MKKFIVFLGMLFITTMIYAKQFCVRIDCEKYIGKDFVGCYKYEEVNVEDEINKYLNKGYKLIAITSKTIVCGYGSKTFCYYCIFDDGE